MRSTGWRRRVVGMAFTAALALAGCDRSPDDGASSGGHAGSTTSTTGGSGGAGGSAVGGSGGYGGTGGSAVGGWGGSSVGGSGGSGAAEVPLDGFGTIDGDCGLLDPADLTSSAPGSLQSSIDFGAMPFDYDALSVGGKEVYDDGNLGGSSLYSEVFAYEVLYRCELAELLKTEGEVLYQDAGGKKTDLIVEIDGYSIGVSVTRAVSFPPDDPYPVSQAEALLINKLGGVLASTQNVDPADAWVKQILLIMAYGDEHAASLEQAYAQLDAATKADTIVFVAVTHGDDDFIYF